MTDLWAHFILFSCLLYFLNFLHGIYIALVIDRKLKTDVVVQKYGGKTKQVIKDNHSQTLRLESDIRHPGRSISNCLQGGLTCHIHPSLPSLFLHRNTYRNLLTQWETSEAGACARTHKHTHTHTLLHFLFYYRKHSPPLTLAATPMCLRASAWLLIALPVPTDVL